MRKTLVAGMVLAAGVANGEILVDCVGVARRDLRAAGIRVPATAGGVFCRTINDPLGVFYETELTIVTRRGEVCKISQIRDAGNDALVDELRTCL